ncbi:helix-turn-helix domain-containing protein [Flammeovirga sp. SubArs3]|uniref:helix-turn-helix domain-containing protein n=1 Tax=Flammeovirga sp. SubArs3 TaxID=2995316 RepID=UPI00248D171E|nr:helix-turn-helix domain-containing protein [Flammeovirga sp. SubArs3]
MVTHISSFEEHTQLIGKVLSELPNQNTSNYRQLKGGEFYYYTLSEGLYSIVFNVDKVHSTLSNDFILDFSNYENVDYVLSFLMKDMKVESNIDQEQHQLEKMTMMLMEKENKFIFDFNEIKSVHHVLLLFSKEELKEKGMGEYIQYLDKNDFSLFETFDDINILRAAISTTYNYQSKEKEVVQKQLLQSLFSMAFEYFYRRINTKSNNETNTDDHIKAAYIIRDAILNNLEEKPNIKSLSNQLSMSELECNQLFKKVFGQTILKFYNHYRVYYSRELLITNKMGIKEVTYHLGYTDMAYFSKIFKKEFGVSPNDFLKNNGIK